MEGTTNKINIVFLADCLASLTGGAERQIFELAKRLDKDVYRVTIASLECYGNAPREKIESIGCRLVVFPVKRIYSLPGILEGFRFMRFLKEEKINILQTYHFSSDIWGTVFGHLAKVKAIISNRRDTGFWRSKRHIRAYRLINGWVNKIVVVADAVKNMVMTEEGVSDEKIQTIYNGIDLSDSDSTKTADIKKEDIFDRDDFIIMHVANLTPVKGHAFLIEALAGIVPVNSHVQLALIGEDRLDGQISGLVRMFGLDSHVKFLGSKESEDVRALLSFADICVLPSLSEGMSNSILEYMAAGKPVIASSVGGNPELIENGSNGYLFEKENVRELTENLLDLIRDKENRCLMGRNGRKIVENRFSMDKMIGEYEDVFKDVLNGQRPALLHLVSSGGLFGAERVIVNIAKNDKTIISYIGAIRNRHNPHLEVIDEAQRLNLRTAVFDSNGRFDFGVIWRLSRFLKNKNISIIHTHNYKSDIIGFCAAKLANKKWVATNHNWLSSDQKIRFYEKIDAFVLKFAQKVIAVSEEIKSQLLTVHIKKESLQVIDNGIDISKFDHPFAEQEIKDSLNIKGGDIVVTIVGRLQEEKGHRIFLKAVQEAAKKYTCIKCLIVGDGPLMEELTAEAKELGIDHRVTFTGIREDMPEIYSVTDIFVNASFIEGLPMTLLETMASQVPAIVTPVGAVGKVIKHNVNGILVKPGDSQALAEEICRLIDDPLLGHRLAEQAYKDVCTYYSDTAMAERYAQVYAHVLGVT